jgi:hypothetical protein
MKLSAQMTLIIAVVFAVACFGVAINGFASLGEIADAKLLADARGYAWFWAFLGGVATAFALVSWWMIRTHREP